jgi:hypothetical protein
VHFDRTEHGNPITLTPIYVLFLFNGPRKATHNEPHKQEWNRKKEKLWGNGKTRGFWVGKCHRPFREHAINLAIGCVWCARALLDATAIVDASVLARWGVAPDQQFVNLHFVAVAMRIGNYLTM